jgi:hypothetical protein
MGVCYILVFLIIAIISSLLYVNVWLKASEISGSTTVLSEEEKKKLPDFWTANIITWPYTSWGNGYPGDALTGIVSYIGSLISFTIIIGVSSLLVHKIGCGGVTGDDGYIPLEAALYFGLYCIIGIVMGLFKVSINILPKN